MSDQTIVVVPQLFHVPEKRAKSDKQVYAKQLVQLHLIYYNVKETKYH